MPGVVQAAWPDVERIVGDLLAGLTAPGSIGSETPANLQDVLPFIRVRRIGGSDDLITDAARVDVQVYAADAAQAKQLAETARQRILAGSAVTSHGVLDHGRTEAGPMILPADDTAGIRRIVSTYRVSVRR